MDHVDKLNGFKDYLISEIPLSNDKEKSLVDQILVEKVLNNPVVEHIN